MLFIIAICARAIYKLKYNKAVEKLGKEHKEALEKKKSELKKGWIVVSACQTPLAHLWDMTVFDWEHHYENKDKNGYEQRLITVTELDTFQDCIKEANKAIEITLRGEDYEQTW